MDEKVFEFSLLKIAPKFSKFFYLPVLIAFLLVCLVGGICFLFIGMNHDQLVLGIILMGTLFLIGMVPCFYLFAAIHSKLIVYKDRVIYTNWRKKQKIIEIKSDELNFVSIGQFGFWIENQDQKVMLRVYGLQWSVFFEKAFCRSGLKRRLKS